MAYVSAIMNPNVVPVAREANVAKQVSDATPSPDAVWSTVPVEMQKSPTT